MPDPALKAIIFGSSAMTALVLLVCVTAVAEHLLVPDTLLWTHRLLGAGIPMILVGGVGDYQRVKIRSRNATPSI